MKTLMALAVAVALMLTGCGGGSKGDLHRAAGNGYVETAKVLLKEGANVNAKNKNGRTPLYWPMKQGKNNVVKVLVEAGAKYTP